jgi:lipopolysaccharide transport system ATP-binding protein
VLFVSHNAAAVENLCTRGVVLDHGRVVFDGTQMQALEHYARSRPAETGQLDDAKRTGSGELRVSRIELLDSKGQPSASVPAGAQVEVRLYYQTKDARPAPRLDLTLAITNSLGAPIATQSTRFTGQQFSSVPTQGCFICRFDSLPLAPGTYRIDYAVHEPRRRRFAYDAMVHARDLIVSEADFFGGGKLPDASEGPLLIGGSWAVEGTP